jgi:hypothetical protein
MPTPDDHGIDAALCAEARGLLSWTTRVLADRAGVSWHAVICFEYGSCPCMPEIRAALRQALERADIEFVAATGGVRVRLRRAGS